MAKKQGLPGFSEKRQLLFSDEIANEEIDSYGELFVEAERFDDALDFFEKSQNKDKIRKVADISLERGDVSLWIRANKLLQEEPNRKQWEQIGERALANGLYSFALTAFEKSGNSAKVEEAKGRMSIGKPQAPSQPKVHRISFDSA